MFTKEIKNFHKKLNQLTVRNRFSLIEANQGIHLCNNTLYLLRKIVEQHQFDTTDDEIAFFKIIKAEPLSYLVYFNEVRSCELLLPKIGLDNQLAFLKKRMQKVNKFFNKNWDVVHYMEQNLSYLDQQYFTRQNQIFPLYAIPEACYLDPIFFTSHDMLWARIKGMNLFITYLLNIIKQIKSEKRKISQFCKPRKALVWSASKAALTELIYALYSSSVVNNGKEDIKGIATAFEELFNIKLDNIYKTYSEIKTRKDSKTRFLEELIFRFNQKVFEDDDL